MAMVTEAGTGVGTRVSSHGGVPPLFMFGFERSGTTLFSMMLGAHPDLAVPLATTGMWYRYAAHLGRYGDLREHSAVEKLVDDLLREERIQLWDVDFERDEILDGLVDGTFAAIVERFHAIYARKKGKDHWGNIDIGTLDEMAEANRWFPDARFLHIVRDGRDVALSHETMPYGTSNVLECAQQWRHRLSVNLRMGEILGPRRYRVIRYEDLVLDTERVLHEVCDFAGLAYSAQMLRYPEMVVEKVPESRRWLWPELNKSPDKTKCYAWQRRMGTVKRVIFEGEARELLAELGYETLDHLPKLPAVYLAELWYFLARGGRLRRLKSRLGLRRVSKLERQWRKSRSLGDVGN